MLLKVVSMTPGPSLSNDASMAKTQDLQIVTIEQLREVIEQINQGQEAFNNKLKSIEINMVKLPAVKQFNGTRVKLKGYLTQISLKLRYKGPKIATPVNTVTYTGIFLTGKALKWFKPYLTEYQINKATTTNLKTKYIFLSWDNFKNQITQMFGDSEEEATAEQKLY